MVRKPTPTPRFSKPVSYHEINHNNINKIKFYVKVPSLSFAVEFMFGAVLPTHRRSGILARSFHSEVIFPPFTIRQVKGQKMKSGIEIHKIEVSFYFMTFGHHLFVFSFFCC